MIGTDLMRIAPEQEDLSGLLQRYMARPQRHRLLHGFPLAAAMPYAEQQVRRQASQGEKEFNPPYDSDRQLLVGVLPHPFCNPKISGCGFCTFPHESFSAIKAAGLVAAVMQEIDARLAREPSLRRRQVEGLYFGGGTANLTPAEPFRRLCAKLNDAFDLSRAEVSLEGVPAYFVSRQPLLIDILREQIAARHFRISMGIQTFSEERLEQMGRLAFGRAETFAAAVRLAHARGMTASADLLFNLPGQTLTEMRADVRQAIDIGLDQICIYHLVMFRGLGTPWSRNEELLAAAPDNETAARHWEALRETLLENGYYQTTLTNFERRELIDDERRYSYELMSFEPDRYNVLGFGPAGISYAALPDAGYALKTINPESSLEYGQAVQSGLPVWNRFYQYGPKELKILYLTRRLAGLRIERSRYLGVLGADVSEDFPQELAALEEAGLVQISAPAIELTPRGMFFADSIAGLLADRHLRLAQANRRRGAKSGPDSVGRSRLPQPLEPVAMNSNGKGFM